MLLLVTGASGIGKTTVRKLLEPQLPPEVESAELSRFAGDAPPLNLAWRQRTADLAVQHAVRLQAEGRHLLLCGDPVAAVEAVAVPSAGGLDGVGVCLLDADPEAQAARLAERGDSPELLVHHQAFARWMRKQALDPLYMLDVVMTNAWNEMRWDRLAALSPQWAVTVVDTSRLDPVAVADAVLAWSRAVVAGHAKLIAPGLAP